jgi:hypothetical protein
MRHASHVKTYAALLVTALLLLPTACGGSGPSSKPPGPEKTLVPAPAVGTVQGRLLHVGGPNGAHAGPWPGRLLITGSNGTHLTAAIGKDGRFSILLPPGSYRVTATSPRYQGGAEPCRSEPAVTVVRKDEKSVADVVCQLR